MNYRKKNKTTILVIGVLSLLFLVPESAYLRKNLNINGIGDILKSRWDVYFENLSVVTDSSNENGN